jgi:hypothetical protein
MNANQHRSGLEVFLFWAMLFSLGLFVGLFIFEIIVYPWKPEQIAFFFGLGIFYLFANRLLFAYGQLSEFLDKQIKDETTEEDIEKAYHRSGANKTHFLEQLTTAGISLIWLDRNEPYRYTYFGLYLLMVAFVFISNMNLVTGFTVGSILEGFFWGATIVSLFVFAGHLVVSWQVGQLVVQPLLKEMAQSESQSENGGTEANSNEEKQAETKNNEASA